MLEASEKERAKNTWTKRKVLYVAEENKRTRRERQEAVRTGLAIDYASEMTQ